MVTVVVTVAVTLATTCNLLVMHKYCRAYLAVGGVLMLVHGTRCGGPGGKGRVAKEHRGGLDLALCMMLETSGFCGRRVSHKYCDRLRLV